MAMITGSLRAVILVGVAALSGPARAQQDAQPPMLVSPSTYVTPNLGGYGGYIFFPPIGPATPLYMMSDPAAFMGGDAAYCFDRVNPPTPQEMAALMVQMHGGLQTRYNLEGSSWSASPNTPKTLTWSFVPDGTMIPRGGSIDAELSSPSNLFATMDGKFGGMRSTWVNYIQGCFDRYSALTGVRYVRVRYLNQDWDDGAAFPNSPGASGLRGDIRISMHPIDGNGHVLAYDRFPDGGGDMVLDSAESWEENTGAYNRLRNIFSHEHGHGLGLAHVCPDTQTKLMEPFYSSDFDGPQHDDILALQYLYGDTYEPNNTAAQATVLNNLNPLSLETSWTIGAYPYEGAPAHATAIAINSGDQDWFRGNVLVAVPITVTATPMGATYDSSVQNSDSSCSSGNFIDTLHVARLSIQLRGADGTTVLASGTAAATGQSASISFVTVPAGNFYVVISSPDGHTMPQAYTWTITSGSASPPNDNCASATTVEFGSFPGTNYGAHSDGDSFCDPVGTVGGADVWYRFVATCSGSVRVDTCGSAIPTVLTVFPGTQTCPPSISSQIATSCYTTNGNPCSPQSSITFSAVSGSTYLIRVAGLLINGTAPPQYSQGGFVLNISSPSIANDNCATATTVVENQTASGTTCGATPSNVPASCGSATGSPDVWYRYVPSCSGRAGFELCGSGYDTVVAVYTGSCTDLLEVACDDDSSNCSNAQNSYVEADVEAGQAYFVRVTGYEGASGTFGLYISLIAPTNQLCSTASAIVANSAYTGSTCLSQATGTASCGTSNSTPAVWFKYTATCPGTFDLDTCGSEFDTVVSVYSGSCAGLTQIACDDDAGAAGPCPGTHQSFASFSVLSGTTYLIRLSGFNGAVGRYVLRGYYEINDTCANAVGITAASTPFSTLCATADGATACGSATNAPSIWYAYTPPCTGTLVADTCGATYDTVLSVYSGSCGALTEMACNDDSVAPSPCAGSTQSYVTAPVDAGMTYLVRVSGYNGSSGLGTLHVACHPTCLADFNGDFHVTVQDIFDFLSAWFSGNPRADFNHSGTITVLDIFNFLAAWFAGC